MAVLQDETKKAQASPAKTVIRRRAATVVSTSKAPSSAAAPRPAATSPDKTIKAESETATHAAKSAAVARPVIHEPNNAPAQAAPASAAPTAEAPTAAKPGGYQARIISRPPAPPKGLPKQDVTDDDLAKELLAAATTRGAKPGAEAPKPAVVEEESHRRRRHEVSRKILQEERASFGRMNRTKSKKKKSITEAKQTEITTPKAIKRIVRMGDHITVGDLAKRMSVKAGDLIKKLFDMGTLVTLNQNIDYDTAVLVATDFGFEVEKTSFEEETIIEEEKDAPDTLTPRAPIVTVMGHVDHGKTTLLDAIRKSDIAGGEAGGITQHIGAYEVNLEDGRKITFLDTPGHAAFASMRARGAKVTDIVILVVAADDGIMPQTIEAINHAKAANVPIIVAINKVDKPGAEPEKVKKALTEHGLIPEDWGGTTIIVPVSGKTRQGLPELLESLALQAEIMELKANPNKRAKGAVIEARLEKGRGSVATLLVSEGTLSPGDIIVVGPYVGRVRAMNDYLGRPIKKAGPATPVEIQGLDGVPEAGESFVVLKDEKEAKLVAEHRTRKVREQDLIKTSKVSLDQLYAKIQEGDVKEVRVIVKADVQGSAEALGAALKELSTDKVKLLVLHSAAGAITETDVNLASASGAILVGFNVRPEPKARTLAESAGVRIQVYSIIYEVLDDIRNLMEGTLAPTLKENYIGRAEVRETFRISKVGVIAGCMVVDGKITRSAKVRLLRDNVVIQEGKISSLKRFKDDAREVAQGTECGIGIENYNDIKVGDVIEAFVVEEIATKL